MTIFEDHLIRRACLGPRTQRYFSPFCTAARPPVICTSFLISRALPGMPTGGRSHLAVEEAPSVRSTELSTAKWCCARLKHTVHAMRPAEPQVFAAISSTVALCLSMRQRAARLCVARRVHCSTGCKAAARRTFFRELLITVLLLLQGHQRGALREWHIASAGHTWLGAARAAHALVPLERGPVHERVQPPERRGMRLAPAFCSASA